VKRPSWKSHRPSAWPSRLRERPGCGARSWRRRRTTTLQRGDGHGRVAIDGLGGPRLEPEIVFVLASTPPPRPTLQQLFECIDAIAPGFEAVPSHCPAWKFNAAETVAEGGLHGRLHVGRPLSARLLGSDGEALDAQLAGMSVELACDGRWVESGQGANVSAAHPAQRQLPAQPCLSSGTSRQRSRHPRTARAGLRRQDFVPGLGAALRARMPKRSAWPSSVDEPG
jgi:hypothetical protein